MSLDELDLDVYSPGVYSDLTTPIVNAFNASAASDGSSGDPTNTSSIGNKTPHTNDTDGADMWRWDWSRVDVMGIRDVHPLHWAIRANSRASSAFAIAYVC